MLDGEVRRGGADGGLDRADQLHQRNAAPAGDVDDVADGLVRARSQEIRADDVADVDEVARLQAVAVDDRALAGEEAGHEARDRRRIFALRILPWPVDVEEPERDA